MHILEILTCASRNPSTSSLEEQYDGIYNEPSKKKRVGGFVVNHLVPNDMNVSFLNLVNKLEANLLDRETMRRGPAFHFLTISFRRNVAMRKQNN